MTDYNNNSGYSPVFGLTEFCTRCGAELRPEDRFCPKCGTPKTNTEPTITDIPNQETRQANTVQPQPAQPNTAQWQSSQNDTVQPQPAQPSTAQWQSSQNDTVQPVFDNYNGAAGADAANANTGDPGATSTYFAGANSAAATPGAASFVQNNKRIIIAAAAVVVVVIAIIVLVNGGLGNNADFKSLYDEHCESTWADVGSDGSYLSIDTNPYNVDDGKVVYAASVTAIKAVNADLGLPDSLISEMEQTNALSGVRKEEYEDQGVSVTWSYHPDNGLEVRYSHLD